MTSTNAIHRRPLQFSLRELFVWVTLFAIGLSIFTSRCQSIGLWLVLYALSLRLLRAHVRRIPTGISRRRLFRKRFWRVVCATLPIAACLNLVTYCDSCRANWTGRVCDGADCVGWPFVFRASGGEFQGPFYDFNALYVDIAACVAIALVTGLALKDGGRRVSTTMARFLRGRSLMPHPRFDWERR